MKHFNFRNVAFLLILFLFSYPSNLMAQKHWSCQWNATDSLITAQTRAGVIAYNNYLYCVGGQNGDAASTVVQYAPILIHGALGKWKTTSSLNSARFGFGLAIDSINVGGNTKVFLYATAGAESKYNYLGNSVEFAEIKSDGSLGKWTQTHGNPNYLAGQSGTFIQNNNLYSIGGTKPSGNLYVTAGYYAAIDQSTGNITAWQALNMNPSGIFGGSYPPCIGYEGKIYNIAGELGDLPNKTINYTNIETTGDSVGNVSNWLTYAPIPKALKLEHRLTKVFLDGNKVFLMPKEVQPTNTIYEGVFDENNNLGNWQYQSIADSNVGGASYTVYNDVIYSVGGTQKSTTQTIATKDVFYTHLNEPAATVYTFSPDTVEINENIAIAGAGFYKKGVNDFLLFAGQERMTLSGINYKTHDSLIVKVPVGTKTGPFQVISRPDTSNFSDTLYIKPTFSSMSKSTAKIGDELVLTGLGFEQSAKDIVVFYPNIQVPVASNGGNGTQLNVTIPNGSQTGPVSIISNGIGSSEKMLTITPVIDSIRPVCVLPGQALTIYGNGFSTAEKYEVTVGQSLSNAKKDTATAYEVEPNKILVLAPEFSENASVYVYSSGETISSNAMLKLTPVIDSISSKPLNTGEELTIAGKHFYTPPWNNKNSVTKQLSVCFANEKEVSPSTKGPFSSKSLTVSIPYNTASGTIVVNSCGCSSAPSQQVLQITPKIKSVSAPVVNGIAQAAIGDTITVKGSSFNTKSSSNAISFTSSISTGKRPLAIAFESSNTEMQCVVPAGAGTGTIMASVSGVNSSDNILFEIVPVIDSIVPIFGAPGAKITIYGSGFSDTANFLQYKSSAPAGFTDTKVSYVSPTQLSFIVPSDMLTGSISIKTWGLKTVLGTRYKVDGRPSSKPFLLTTIPDTILFKDVTAKDSTHRSGDFKVGTYGDETFSVIDGPESHSVGIRGNNYKPLYVKQKSGAAFTMSSVDIKAEGQKLFKAKFYVYYQDGTDTTYVINLGGNSNWNTYQLPSKYFSNIKSIEVAVERGYLAYISNLIVSEMK